MTSSPDWNALAHRALVTAALYYPQRLGPRSGTPKVLCSMPGDVREAGDAEMLVTVDAPELDAEWFARTRGALVAVVVASRAALGLLSSAPHAGGHDAYARAAAWAAFAENAPRAPAVTPARLREIVAAASSAGLVLVEPDVPHVPVQPKQAVDRAVLATMALGATARPLLFVPERAAPKGGLARARDERLLDGWIEGRAMRASPESLLGAALSALADASAPLPGKDLLREARIRWADAARAAGARVTTSSADAGVLAKELRFLWLDGAIEVYAADPSIPLVVTG